jgi:hypothetical protein
MTICGVEVHGQAPPAPRQALIYKRVLSIYKRRIQKAARKLVPLFNKTLTILGDF